MTLASTQINLRDALAVWRRNVVVHLRLWKLNLVAPIIEPVISVLGFGWGIGALVAGEGARPLFLNFSGAGRLGVSGPFSGVVLKNLTPLFFFGFFINSPDNPRPPPRSRMS